MCVCMYVYNSRRAVAENRDVRREGVVLRLITDRHNVQRPINSHIRWMNRYHTYMHTYIHIYVRTYIHTYNTYIHTHTHTYIHI